MMLKLLEMMAKNLI